MKPLSIRFLDHWDRQGWIGPGERVAVACSGGLDSIVLLHLIRFGAQELDLQVAAAHFDHGMRAGSGADAQWLRGLTRCWGVPLHLERAAEVPHSEADARDLRYRFLEGLVRDERCDSVLTAHHADDQVETILFRILRGTGLDGLGGIPASRDPGILRPLLPFGRADLEDYARRCHLRSRRDPSNASLRFARNRLRHRVLPLLEDTHPGARDALLRLARISKRTAEAMNVLIDLQLDRVIAERGGGQVVLERGPLLEFPDSVMSVLIRRAAATLGFGLTEAGTASAVEFIRSGASGTRVDLPGRACLAREFDRVRVFASEISEGRAAEMAPGEQSLEIRVPGSGSGEICLSGWRFRVCWGTTSYSDPQTEGGADGGWEWTEFVPGSLSFPILVRGWRPGDRMRIRSGRKKLKKVFRESQVPRHERDRIPVIVDSEGLVVWFVGHAPSEWGASQGQTDDPWRLGVRTLDSP